MLQSAVAVSMFRIFNAGLEGFVGRQRVSTRCPWVTMSSFCLDLSMVGIVFSAAKGRTGNTWTDRDCEVGPGESLGLFVLCISRSSVVSSSFC